MGLLLKNGWVMNHQGKGIQIDVLLKGDRVHKLGKGFPEDHHQVIDCEGKWVLPGFIDMHVHLREPGFEHKETIESGTRAAAKGGFTTIACMPNTKPVLDAAEQIQSIHDQAKRVGAVNVLPIGAITQRQLGETLCDFEAMQRVGIVAVSDDGVGVQSAGKMKEAMSQAAKLGLPVVAHCEDNSLIQGGCVHDGAYAQTHGLRGIPSECEAVHIARDILLAEQTGVHYHVCHISTKESVRLVREAKHNGIPVTAEVTPHHLLLSENDIPGLDPNFKMNPPLRSEEDRQALIEGLLDGTIDFIATDHAPHAQEEKEMGMERAPFGIVGLETAFPLLYTHLVQKGLLTLKALIDKLTRVPAERFNLARGTLREGAIADITIVDLELEQSINPRDFASKGQNTPFTNWTCQGWPTMTIVNGQVVWSTERGIEQQSQEGVVNHD
ncbi:dihydroorotase [Caldalkalibacillus salinus]|uniref:dihydroorotase n=1 Tax=Caldalkalibacillus salinus TaxID=2803787 RepID=UPI001921858A|nr:dihydroorotase [Caldalkalibacillus salinus]